MPLIMAYAQLIVLMIWKSKYDFASHLYLGQPIMFVDFKNWRICVVSYEIKV